MIIIDVSTAPIDEGPDTMFAGGVVSRYNLIGANDSPDVWISQIRFAPGARTKMHAHTYNQIVYVIEGRGILATETERREVGPGTVVYFPAGEPHWHGATPESSFAHITVGTHGTTERLEE
jgi:quercetin dioxygenase-like cupin family protein